MYFLFMHIYVYRYFVCFKTCLLPSGEEDRQLGQLQMFKKKPKQCVKRRKRTVFASCLRILRTRVQECVSRSPHFALLIKKNDRAKNETLSAAGSARTTGLVSGTGVAQLRKVSDVNVTTQSYRRTLLRSAGHL